jgi:integrase/recombinase XerD
MTNKLPIWMSQEEFALLIKNTYKTRHKVAFLLGYGSGMRISEIINLQQTDINLQNKSIVIREGKGGKDRVVPLPKGWKDSMLQYIPLKCGIRALQRVFTDTAKRSGVMASKPGVHVHSLRHSFAVRCIEAGVPLNQIQLLMGHSNIATTSIYLHANPKDALKSYEELF